MIFITLSVYAQPIINYNDLNQPFTANGFSIQDSSLLSGASGENVVWDFSTLNVPSVNTVRLVPASQTPFYSNFPLSNYCFELTYPTITAYQYFNLTPSSLEFLGQAYPPNYVITYNLDPLKVFEFPYIYNSTFTDTYRFATASNIDTVVNKYDSYGTLILPFGTFTNVIRQKRLLYNEVQYYWYNTNPYYEIAQLSIESGPFGQRTFSMWQDSTQLSSPENETQSSWTLYPNPNNGNFTIRSKQQIQKIIITDITGKEILIINPNSLSTDIKLENCKNGLYLIKCISDETQSIKKFIVK